MTHSRISRHKLIAGAAVLVMTLTTIATPAARNVAVAALVSFAEVTGRVARFPCWLLDYSRCFSLDRLDPTCPQCI